MLGDLHGKCKVADRLLAEVLSPDIKQVIQVGDYGWWPKSIEAWTTEFKPICRFIDGNHENFKELERLHKHPRPYRNWKPGWDITIRNWQHMKRGTIVNGVLYIGGARSPDKAYRTPGVDWFPEESLSKKDRKHIMGSINLYGPENIHTVITHDCPAVFRVDKIIHNLRGWPDGNNRFLTKVFNKVRPKRWFFGHYHCKMEGEVAGTSWRCIGEIETGDFVIVDLS